jgi:hypothetical protein
VNGSVVTIVSGLPVTREELTQSTGPGFLGGDKTALSRLTCTTSGGPAKKNRRLEASKINNSLA